MDRKKKYDNKFIRKTIRFTPDEFNALEKQRLKTNLNFSDFVRKSSSKIKIVSKLDQDIIFHLSKIGNNLNQIARAINKKEKIPVLNKLVEIEKQLKELTNGS
ncbi:MAG: MobC family plasmid mobilization relaxosome protein [Arcobacter sp.]|nr:MobC family plasmid mobilization relaxosome protein [Arcobacter sp.]